jgi:hypothetical protein
MTAIADRIKIHRIDLAIARLAPYEIRHIPEH